MGKEKVQFTLIFYLKQNEEVQLDLQIFEIFMFLPYLSSLPPGEVREEKLTYGFLRFGICVIKLEKVKELEFSMGFREWKTRGQVLACLRACLPDTYKEICCVSLLKTDLLSLTNQAAGCCSRGTVDVAIS